ISLNNTNMILAGSIPAAMLAIIFDLLLSRLQRFNFKKIKTATALLPVLLVLLASLYFIPSAYGGKLTAGFTPEFMGRQDGNLGLQNKYGLKIHTIVISDAVMYKAAYENQLDVISGYSTDGRLKAYNLVVLNDDKAIFPPYYAAPIVRDDALKKFPALEKTLNLLSGKINDSAMTELNYKTDYLHQSPEKVAEDFLRSKDLLKPARNGNAGIVRIGSKIFGEQYILASIYTMLIKGYTDYDVATKTGLGGTKICFDALTNNQIDLYPEYTGTGLLAILQPSSKIVDSLSTDRNKTYNYVQREFKAKFNIEWLKPIGFNNAYALMMREKQAKKLNIKTISDLKRYLESK
ncbi:MAG: transporter permease subunit, partial [Mucilaginibacter sp.]|nr:transporter permease subunit [Mucilaginibacter sp.]